MKLSDLINLDCSPVRMTNKEKFWRIIGLVGWVAIYLVAVASVFMK